MYSTFPAGWPGIGLLLLRGIMGADLMLQGLWFAAMAGANEGFRVTTIVVLLAATGALAIVGFMSPAVQCAIVGTQLLVLTSRPALAGDMTAAAAAAWPPIAVITIAVSMMLLGPGAYSIDRYLFGRREIVIPPTIRSAAD